MGNFSRDTFDELKQYVSVRLQQGVPLVDADWNEQDDIRRYELRAFLKWFVGDGIPPSNPAFSLTPVEGSNDFGITGPDDGPAGSGRCLVDGWEVMINRSLQYTDQRLYADVDPEPAWGEAWGDTLAGLWDVDQLPRLTTPKNDRTDVVYLDVWEREVTAAEDEHLVNEAIGLETSVRLKLEWLVRVAEDTLEPPAPKPGHAVYLLAWLIRPAGQKAITAEHIIDLRTTIAILAQQTPGTGLTLQPHLTATTDNDTLTALHLKPTFNDRDLRAVKKQALIVESGNVGIGTPAPEALLHVANPRNDNSPFQGLLQLTATSTGSHDNRFDEKEASFGIEFQRIFWKEPPTQFGGIYAWGTRSNGSGLAFRTRHGGNEPELSTSMVITDEGNVGIGTAAPDAILKVEKEITAATEPLDIVSLELTGELAKDKEIYHLRFWGVGDKMVGSMHESTRGRIGLGGFKTAYREYSDPPGATPQIFAQMTMEDVTVNGAPSDYAEWLPRLHGDETIEPGDIVGVFAGKITKQTENAHHIMVLSSGPLVVGNKPEAESKHLYEQAAFIGQVPVKVRGKVQAGDYIIPSGQGDGTGVAVSPERITPVDYAHIVGQAWESSSEPEVKLINTAVGLHWSYPQPNQVATTLQAQAEEINRLKSHLAELSARIPQSI